MATVIYNVNVNVNLYSASSQKATLTRLLYIRLPITFATVSVVNIFYSC